MLIVSITVLISVISIYIFIHCIEKVINVIRYGILTFKQFKKADEDEVGIEIPEVEEPRYRYDVNAFRQRMQMIRDEDGLYDVQVSPPPTDFTGAEIITADAELDIEKYVGRK